MNSIITRDLKELGVNTKKLSLYKNQTDKKKYIIQSLKEIMQNDLKAFNKKHNKNKLENKHLRKMTINKFNIRNDKNKKIKNMFSWLNLKSDYKYLKNSLSNKLIQVISQPDNADIIEQLIKSYRNIKNKNKSFKLDEFKSNIIYHLTSNNTEEEGEKDEEEIKNYNCTNIKEIRLENFNEDVNNDDNNIASNNKINSFKWNKKFEEKFKTKKMESKLLLIKKYKSSKLYDCAISECLREFKNNDSTNEKREYLLTRYMSGHEITKEELRFLAYTSDTLNLFLDKGFYKDALKILDKNIIDKIELEIASKIIENYTQLKTKLLKKREEYYKCKTDRTRIQSKYTIISKENNNLYQNRRLQQIYKSNILKNNYTFKTNNFNVISGKQKNKSNSILNNNPINSNINLKNNNLHFNRNILRSHYSTGPLTRNHYKKKNLQEKVKAAIIIQKNIRRFLAKLLKNRLELKKRNLIFKKIFINKIENNK